jgi:hypothetical protein
MLLQPRFGNANVLAFLLRGCQGFDLGMKRRWHVEDNRLAS